MSSSCGCQAAAARLSWRPVHFAQAYMLPPRQAAAGRGAGTHRGREHRRCVELACRQQAVDARGAALHCQTPALPCRQGVGTHRLRFVYCRSRRWRRGLPPRSCTALSSCRSSTWRSTTPRRCCTATRRRVGGSERCGGPALLLRCDARTQGRESAGGWTQLRVAVPR